MPMPSMPPSDLTAQALTGLMPPPSARMTMGRKGIPLLGKVPLFSGLSKRHLRRLADLAEDVRFAGGRQIVQAGTPGKAFFVILEGNAKVYRGVVPTGRAIARLGPGDFFGELALLDGGPRTASVVADSRVTAVRLSRGAFQKLLKSEPDIAVAIMVGLARRAREAGKLLTE